MRRKELINKVYKAETQLFEPKGEIEGLAFAFRSLAKGKMPFWFRVKANEKAIASLREDVDLIMAHFSLKRKEIKKRTILTEIKK